MKRLSILLLLFFINTNSFAFNLDPDDFATPLMQALEDKKSPEIIGKLIKNGENVNATKIAFLRCFKPVLCYAIARGTDAESVKIIKMLLNADANVRDATTYNRVEDTQVYGFMPILTYAAIYSSAEVVQLLIDAGARDSILRENPITFKKSALEIAQELGKQDVVNVLQRAHAACIN